MARSLPRLKFSLFSLLVSVSLACVMLAGAVSQWRMVKARQALWAQMNEGSFSVRVISIPGNPHLSISWLRQALGDFGQADLVYSPSDDPHQIQLRQVRKLFPESTIWGWPGTRSLPAGIKPLADGQYYRI